LALMQLLSRPNLLRHNLLPYLCAVLLSGCAVGPNYVRPTADVPTAYKETPPNWKAAQPSDAIAKGRWWEIYQDPQLNALEEQVNVSNQTLKIAQAQFEQARAALKVTRSNLFPTISGAVSETHFNQSSNRPIFSSSSSKGNGQTSYQDYVIPVDASYEADVWGRVRRTVEASRSQAQASAADLANAELSVRAELAFDYFSLRGLDAQKKLLDSTVISFQKALELTQNRYKGGLASAVDVAQAQTQLETTRGQDIDVGVARAAFEHAIAVLVGKPASDFSLPPSPLEIEPPMIPEGLPSELLERRPDIAAAERRVQEANANIGVARAAYFPTVTLSASGGFESGVLGTLFQGPSGFWSIGGSALETLFDAGRRRGLSEQAIAAYNQNVANYRQTVLAAFQDVEDNLSALRILQEESGTESAAVAAAEHSVALSLNRYRGGIANYLEVTTAQSAALADEVTAVNILTRRMTASVLLVKAVGGGWNASQIPSLRTANNGTPPASGSSPAAR
jgi:NodT family efflux transporter outer membrane factor (OMF) lipoprotein